MNNGMDLEELLQKWLKDTKASEEIKKVMSYLEDELATNKHMSGINFSFFIGYILGVIVSLVRKAWENEGRCRSSERPIRESDGLENRLMFINFRIAGVAKALQDASGKCVSFHEIFKAIMVIGIIPRCGCPQELEKLLYIVQELMQVKDDYEINFLAIQLFERRF